MTVKNFHGLLGARFALKFEFSFFYIIFYFFVRRRARWAITILGAYNTGAVLHMIKPRIVKSTQMNQTNIQYTEIRCCE